MKKLSKEGIFECGLLDVAKTKLRALTPVVMPDPWNCMGLGLAVANEPGYHPVPAHWCRGDTYDEMAAHADELNLELFDLDPRAAALVVSSSMAAGKTTRGKLRSTA